MAHYSKPRMCDQPTHLPDPKEDSCPIATQFVLDVGDFYSSISNYEVVTHRKNYKKFRAFEKLKQYLSDAFIEVLKKELKLDERRTTTKT